MVDEKKNPGGLGEKVAETLTKAFKPIGESAGEITGAAVGKALVAILESLENHFAPILGPLADELLALPGTPLWFKAILLEIKQPQSEVAALMGQSLSSGLIGGATSSILTPILAPMVYAMNKFRPVAILSPAEEIIAHFRGLLKSGWFEDVLLSHGYNATNMDLLREISRPLLDINSLREIYFRFPKERPAIDNTLRAYGFKETDITQLELIWEVIPGPADQVRFAVREAFDPAAITKYGLGAAFPDQFATEVAKVGLSPTWALRYWYSHWVLPSTSQGFEMLHRGVINRETLLDLMRYADILPWWHDKLIAIAYSPYTRVDVRRMQAMGIIDRAAVKRSYLDLGFDDEKAENMTEFTIRFNQAANRELTKADILDGLAKGLLTMDESEADLAALGYDEDEVDFYVQRQDLKRQETLKTQYSARYKILYVKNLIDEAGLRAEMVPLGFTAGEITELVKLWEIEKRSKKETTLEEKERDLARADITDGYRRGIFSQAEARELLSKLGYDADEIDFYLTREDYKRDEENAKEFIAAYRRQYLQGVINEDQARTAMSAIPLPPEQVNHLLNLWLLDRESQEWSPIAPQERDLTRADILDVYSKRIIPRAEAESMLGVLGYDANEIGLLLAKTDFEGEKTKRQLSVTTYRNLYTTGILDKTSTTAALAELGFAEQEIEYMYELWDIEAMDRLKLPTRAELTRFLKKDIINVATWRTLLAQMGYPDTVIKWYEEDMEE